MEQLLDIKNGNRVVAQVEAEDAFATAARQLLLGDEDAGCGYRTLTLHNPDGYLIARATKTKRGSVELSGTWSLPKGKR